RCSEGLVEYGRFIHLAKEGISVAKRISPYHERVAVPVKIVDGTRQRSRPRELAIGVSKHLKHCPIQDERHVFPLGIWKWSRHVDWRREIIDPCLKGVVVDVTKLDDVVLPQQAIATVRLSARAPNPRAHRHVRAVDHARGASDEVSCAVQLY